MIIKRADFITSMKDYGEFATKGCPEVAFAGKFTRRVNRRDTVF